MKKQLVSIIRRKGRGLVLRWTDPETGRIREEATGCTTYAEAAGKIALKTARLQANDSCLPVGMVGADVPWELFCERYHAEKISQLRPKSQKLWHTAAARLEQWRRPDVLGDITESTLSAYTAFLWSEHLAPLSIVSYLRQLRTALGWAAFVYRTYQPPRVMMPRVKGRVMRGRPINQEEFERMLAATAAVVGNRRAKSWRRLLRGLWLSGIRLGESLQLRWNHGEIAVLDIDSQSPKLQFSAGSDKGQDAKLIPITPDFAAFLRGCPPAIRRGRVFRLQGRQAPCLEVASRTIGQIGRQAGIRVSPTTPTGRQARCATAHDLRRSFGTRWAPRVKPIVLQMLMRHKNIQTTLQHYVQLDVEEVSRELCRQVDTLVPKRSR